MNEPQPLQSAGLGPTRRKKPESWGSFLRFLAYVVLGVLIFRSFVFAPFTIPSESMLPLLENGDYLVAAKWPYGYSRLSLPFDVPLIPGRLFAGDPERGDVVIFKHPVDRIDYIKRAIGLPGDTVALRGGQVILNGKAVPRKRVSDFILPVSPNTHCAWGAKDERLPDGRAVCRYMRYRETLPSGRSYETLDFGFTPQDDFGPVKVPAGHIFVLGDNRDNSADSRFPAASGGGVGIVPTKLLVARATVVLWSTDGSAKWFKPWTWSSSARWHHIGERL